MKSLILLHIKFIIIFYILKVVTKLQLVKIHVFLAVFSITNGC